MIGITKTAIAKALARDIAAQPMWAGKGAKEALSRLIKFLEVIPQEVIAPIEKLHYIPKVPIAFYHPREGMQFASGLYMGKGPTASKYPQVSIEGIGRILSDIGATTGTPLLRRGAEDVVQTVQHEMGHALLDALKRHVGYRAYMQAVRAGTGRLKYGLEEPFASMLEELSPGEVKTFIDPYVKSIKENVPRLVYTSPIAKALQRAIKQGKISAESARKYVEERLLP